ncbi:MAG TPA: C1 family peptidase [Blastocatellia bacterium]
MKGFPVKPLAMAAMISSSVFMLVLSAPLTPARVQASPVQSPPSTALFDTCVLDNSETTLFQFSSITGQYQLTVSSTGFVLTGTGVVMTADNSRTLTDSESDRRVTADFDLATLTGTATVDFMEDQGVWETFRALATVPGNSCTCYPFADDYVNAACSSLSGNDDIDWRTKGAVTPVKNQGSLKADWAFSATGAIEGWAAITTGKLPSLSEQQLIDCAPQTVSAECGGGSPIQGLKYAAENGICSAASYPYTARQGTCKNCSPVVRPSGFKILCPGEARLESAIVQGPVSAVVVSDWMPGFTGGGVIDPPQCNTLGPHTYTAVLVVGVVNSGTPFWIVKNSLGTSWGQQGYFNLVKGKNACGIGNFLAIPD